MPRPGKKAPRFRPGGSQDRPRAAKRVHGVPRITHGGLTTIPDWVDQSPEWVKVLPVNPIPTLLRQAHAALTLRVLALLCDDFRSRDYTLFKELNQAAYHSPAVTKIIKHQRDDGTWPTKAAGQGEEITKQLVLIELLENLRALAILGGSKRWPSVQKGMTALLGFQHEDGRFPLLYHHHAAIGSLLIELGLIRNPAVHKAAHWILERQREDGGWLHPQMAAKTKHPASCIWTTAEVLNFLTRYQTLRIKERLERAGEFRLGRALQPNTTTLLPEAGAWNVLSTSTQGVRMFQGGTLKVLEGLAPAGFNPSHSGFKKLYDWLIDQQLENGYFPRIAGMDNEGDAWVTVRALGVIRRIETTRPV